MPRLLDTVVPLYRLLPGGLPEHYGSGTLFSFGGAGFLGTAGHCFDKIVESGVFIPVGGQVTGVEGVGRRSADPFDLGYIRLPAAMTAALASEKMFLTGANIDPDDVASPGAHYSFVGFPWRQSTRSVGGKLFRQRVYMFTGRTLRPNQMTGLNPHIHIAVEFDRAQVKAADGSVQTAPMPEGMSGGPVFRGRLRVDEPGRADVRLAGIAMAFGPGRLETVRIAGLLQLIREFEPDIAPSVPVSNVYHIDTRDSDASSPAAP